MGAGRQSIATPRSSTAEHPTRTDGISPPVTFAGGVGRDVAGREERDATRCWLGMGGSFRSRAGARRRVGRCRPVCCRSVCAVVVVAGQTKASELSCSSNSADASSRASRSSGGGKT